MRKEHGFTLIELLIVIVLIGIVSTMSMLSMTTGDRRDWQRHEAERLLHLLELASQEAVIRAAPVAVEIFSNGYRFMIEKGGKWRAEVDDAMFRPRNLPPSIFLQLEIDNKTVALNGQESTFRISQPHIVLTPDGDVLPFRIRIGLIGGERAYLVANSADGGMVMLTYQDSAAS